MFPKNQTQKQVIGRIGEDSACKYLEKNGYKVVDRNYLKKWGELDIVARKSNKLHFIEVKSVSCETNKGDVTCVTSTPSSHDGYRPEDNLHPWKLQRLSRVIQSYLIEKDISDDIDWQFDIITVLVNKDKKLSRVTLIEDIIL